MYDDALQLKALASRDQLGAIDASQLLYLLVGISPSEQIAEHRTALNLSLVIDRSTSMNGERLNRVKQAASNLIDNLAPNDVISVIAFSDRADAVVPSRRVGNKQTLMAQVNGIIASGGTEIFQGLSAGVNELRKVGSREHVQHLILLTDGHTYGDADDCLHLARECAEQRIGFSAFGIGTEWNDDFLDQLVGPSGGRSGYIEKPDEIVEFLRTRVQGLGAVFAHNLRLTTEIPAGVTIKSGFKVTPFAQPLPVARNEIKLGAIEGNTPVACLLEVEIDPMPVGHRLRIPIEVRADIPQLQTRDALFRTHMLLEVLQKPVQKAPPAVVMEAVQALNFYRLNEQAWQAVEAGQFDMASKMMRSLTGRLQAAGHTQLAAQALNETVRIERSGAISSDGHKRLKFGTRALATKTVRLTQ